jgi:hypothetical protein
MLVIRSKAGFDPDLPPQNAGYPQHAVDNHTADSFILRVSRFVPDDSKRRLWNQ